MAHDLREFLGQFQRGIEVCVSGTGADTLLAVREAFRRYFQDGLGRPVAVAVVPQEAPERPVGLAASDDEAIRRARSAARELEARLPGTYHFYLAAEASVHPLDVEGRTRFFVRYWTAVVGVAGESLGSSGAIQLPDRLMAGATQEDVHHAVPGTRRAGGTIASLTGGLETRRSAVATSTLHAIATLFYGILESGRGGSR
jgi:non-canonical (house-cleaning) NTP pyrophosphatase